MESKIVVRILSALAHESRLTVFKLLVQAGPTGLTAGQISTMTKIPPSSLSFHLKELSHAELVTSRQDSRYVIYRANYPTMNAVLAYLAENCCEGLSCITTCAVTDEPSPGVCLESRHDLP